MNNRADDGFVIKVHPYCRKCKHFMCDDEAQAVEEFNGGISYLRTITCTYYYRCEKIENIIKEEVL